MKPFLVLQLRPETEASDNAFAEILRAGGLAPDQAHRIGRDRAELAFDAWFGVIVGGGTTCQLTQAGRCAPVCPNGRIVGHREAVQALPPGCVPLLASLPCPVQMICFGVNVYAMQAYSPGRQRRLRGPHPHLQEPRLFPARDGRRSGGDVPARERAYSQ